MSAYYNENNPYAAQWLRNLIKAGQIAAGDVDERSIVDVRPDDLRGYTQCHFFAGIGVWSYALRLAGWSDDRPVWTGSCPCQPFSVAGAGAGTNDHRHLWPIWYELIRQCRPATVFGEQVAGKAGLEWFGNVRADLEASGYAAGCADLCAASIGAPHVRQRLFWVANTNSHGLQGRLSGREDTQREAIRGSTGCSSPIVPFGFEKVVFSMDCGDDGDCHECGYDYSECLCIGPTQDACSYLTLDGVLYGKRDGEEWSGPDFRVCKDGKTRPIESELEPLVDGAAFRVGSGCADWEGKSRAEMLKAYGNAIVPQVAAAVIGAFMEYAP